MVFNPDFRPSRNEQVRWQAVDEEGILVNLETGFYFSLNPVALFIWDLCDGEASNAQILAKIVENFDVVEETARQDFEAFLEALESENLLVLSPPQAS